MNRKKKTILSLLLGCVLATGTITAFSGIAQSETKSTAISPASLWEQTTGFEVEANVEVPDTMKYGAVVNGGFTEWIDENSTEDYLEDWEKNGVKITSTAPNKAIYFNNVLNVDTLTQDDCLLAFSPLATTQGSADFTAFDICLEDVDNPGNYLKIQTQLNAWWQQGTVIRAGTQDISPRAYRWSIFNDEWNYHGVETCYTSFNGTSMEAYDLPVKSYRHRAIKLFYDAETTTLTFEAAPQGIRYPVAKLNDEWLVGYGTEWGGFKANRVRLSVTLKSFLSTSASVMILNVFGQEMNGATIVDKEAPVLKFDEAANELPTAQVGKSYSLFNYSCDDLVSGDINCNITVKDPDGQNVAIANGAWTPTKSGQYTVNYQAQDTAGNAVEKTFSVIAKTGMDTLNVDVNAGNLQYSVGDTITLPTATASGGAGMLSKMVSVKRVGGENVKVENGTFTPMLAGEYLATYTATDYVGNQATKTIVFTVIERNKPLLMPVQKILKLFDNIPVDVPMPTAYDFTSLTGNKLNASVEITAKNVDGTYSEKIENGIFTPDKAKFGNSVTFAYKVQCNGGVGQAEEFAYTVAIDNVPTLAEDYFVFDKSVFATNYNEGGGAMFLNFTTQAGVTGTQSISFANPLGAEGFELNFAIPAKAKNFQTLTFKLRDSMNAAIGFDMEIRQMTTGVSKDSKLFVRSGGVDYAMSGIFNTMSGTTEVPSTTPLRLRYLDGVIMDYSGARVFAPTVNFDGEEFTGFPSGKVYLEMQFAGVTGEAGITITKINNQTFGKMYSVEENIITGKEYYEESPFEDIIRPVIRFDEDIPEIFTLGQTVEIPFARAFDVLSPHVDVLITLRAPSGKYIYKSQLLEEGMSFVVDAVGVYNFKVEARDSAGRRQESSFTITVNDSIAPTVVLSIADTMELKVGDTLQLVDLESYAILQDNLDNNPSLTVMVITPEHEIVPLRNPLSDSDTNANTSYTFKKAGKYVLRYYVTDASYNTTWKDVTVVVK